MQQAYRMRKNGQFRYVYRKGKHASGKLLSLNYVRAARLQAGFSVSKKVGNAVTRNLVKRRVREYFRLLIPRLQTGYYVFTAHPGAGEAGWLELCREIQSLLSKLRLVERTT